MKTIPFASLNNSLLLACVLRTYALCTESTDIYFYDKNICENVCMTAIVRVCENRSYLCVRARVYVNESLPVSSFGSGVCGCVWVGVVDETP